MHSRTRPGLLAGAARAFAEHGLRGCTMQAIAQASGVAKGTLYNYFRTKDEVARALLRAELDRLAADTATLRRDEALARLADELAGHPVLRRLAVTEPELLAGLLTSERWPDLTALLAATLRIDEDGAELAGRWLLGVTLQPGRAALRHRHAAVLAGLLSPAAAAAGP